MDNQNSRKRPAENIEGDSTSFPPERRQFLVFSGSASAFKPVQVAVTEMEPQSLQDVINYARQVLNGIRKDQGLLVIRTPLDTLLDTIPQKAQDLQNLNNKPKAIPAHNPNPVYVVPDSRSQNVHRTVGYQSGYVHPRIRLLQTEWHFVAWMMLHRNHLCESLREFKIEEATEPSLISNMPYRVGYWLQTKHLELFVTYNRFNMTAWSDCYQMVPENATIAKMNEDDTNLIYWLQLHHPEEYRILSSLNTELFGTPLKAVKGGILYQPTVAEAQQEFGVQLTLYQWATKFENEIQEMHLLLMQMSTMMYEALYAKLEAMMNRVEARAKGENVDNTGGNQAGVDKELENTGKP